MFTPLKKPISETAETVAARVKTVTEWYDPGMTPVRIEAQFSGQVTDVRVSAGDKVTTDELLIVSFRQDCPRPTS
jgi:multidrug resistance efflux pump